MRHLPIRVRVAAGFAAAMALVLAATGLFLYTRLGNDLARALDQDLRLRADDLSALVRDPGSSLRGDARSGLIEPGESFAQLLDRSGRVIDETRLIGSHSLLRGAEVSAAPRQSRFFDRNSVPGLDEPARMLAMPVKRAGRDMVLVVGATRENRAETLRNLRTELLIAGPVALVLATLLGYRLAGAGLQTVDAMRRRAARISAERADERLPVPRTGDELEQLGETLNAMLDRLEQALERERGFVAEAGHELSETNALEPGRAGPAPLRSCQREAATAESNRAAYRHKKTGSAVRPGVRVQRVWPDLPRPLQEPSGDWNRSRGAGVCRLVWSRTRVRFAAACHLCAGSRRRRSVNSRL